MQTVAMERTTFYDRQGVKRRLAELYALRGRGTASALGRAVGVTAQSANRWASERDDCPDPSHWPAIEDFFGLQRGDLARAGGMDPPPPAGPAAAALPSEELELAALIGELSPEGKAAAEAYIRFLRSNEKG